MTRIHPLSPKDATTVAALALQSAPFKGMMSGPQARAPYDQMIGAIPAAEGITAEPAILGGVPGFWLRPEASPADAAILYLHGGAYVLGSGAAYCNFAGQFAARSGIAAFVADYALAPERPFPAGVLDARAAYRALLAEGITRILLVGDSAGGGLALSLLHWAIDEVAPAACVAISPWADLTLSSASLATRAEEDPFVTAAMLRTCAAMYLGEASPTMPEASPLFGARTDLPPVQIHVGTREVLLDDSTTYADRAGGRVDLHVWEGMPHVFPSSFPMLEAGESAMGMMAEFLRAALTR